MSKPILLGLALGAAASAAIGAGVAEAVSTPSDVMPLADVKPGMKGYGLTVFNGTKPEKFDVEIINVLRNFRPGQDLILIKTPNHPRLDIAHTVAGMSGSPIYLEGKMIGAYAYGWTFGAEPIAGVTPIQNMIDDLNKPIPPLFKPRASLLPKAGDSGAGKASGKSAFDSAPRALERAFVAATGDARGYDLEGHARTLAARSARERGTIAEGGGLGGTLAPATTPVMMGGLTPGALAFADGMLRPRGLGSR